MEWIKRLSVERVGKGQVEVGPGEQQPEHGCSDWSCQPHPPLPRKLMLKHPMVALARYYLLGHLAGYSSGQGTSGLCGPAGVQQSTGLPAPPGCSLTAGPSVWLGLP